MTSPNKAHGPKRILVGFDGSAGAIDAVVLARVLAPGASADLVHVLPHEDPLARHYQPLGDEDSAVAEGFFDAAIAALDDLETEVHSYVGASPAHVLCDLAEDEDLDLVVVGSPHRGTLGRALIGSVAEALMHGSPTPIVLAPRDYAQAGHDSPTTIAVGYDGTPESDAALRWAENFALALGASLEVLTVVSPSAAARSRSTVAEPYATIEKAIDAVDDAVEVHAHMLVGPVAETVANACEDTDLLVVGSRDYGPLERVLLGSTASRLVHTAPCPVVVVPRGARPTGTLG